MLLAAGLFVCFGALGVRLVWLHVIDRDALLKTIAKVRYQLIPETAQRGDILDARGARLATSTSRIVLGVDPMSLRPQDEKKWPELAAIIGMPEAELRRICLTRYREPAPGPAVSAEAPIVLNLGRGAPVAANASAAAQAGSDDDTDLDPVADEKGRRPIRWAKLHDDISETTYEKIQLLGIHGITRDRVYRRVYPSNQLASHIVGYVNRQQQPVTGIELHADFYLRGLDGWRVGERDGRNRELAQFRTREVPRANGYSVVLSLDLTVQDIIEQELAWIAEKFTPLKATIIVSDPRSGFILGMANYPTFNPNEYNKVPKDEFARMKNVAVADIYEPGSVFKIVPVAGAIEERLVYPQSVIDCTVDKVTYRGTVVSLPSEDHFMGDLSVAEIISHSSNKGAAQLAMKLGDEKFHRYARAFGFGARLGFPVGGEVPGLLNPARQWYPIDITRIAMGHSVSSTVLQMHQAMCVIASGGVLLRPQIISQIRDANGEEVYRFPREEIHRAISPETARKVADMLTGVVRKPGGTAAEAAIDGFDVAGKTGTTQKLIEEVRADGSIKHVYSNKHHIGSFVGFFPAQDPQVAISVIVDEARVQTPSGVAYGRLVAAPSFKRIGERLIPILRINSTHQSSRPSGLIAMQQGGRR